MVLESSDLSAVYLANWPTYVLPCRPLFVKRSLLHHSAHLLFNSYSAHCATSNNLQKGDLP